MTSMQDNFVFEDDFEFLPNYYLKIKNRNIKNLKNTSSKQASDRGTKNPNIHSVTNYCTTTNLTQFFCYIKML